MRVVPPAAISTSSETVDGFQLVIPAKRNVFVLLFLLVWLVFWALGEATAFHQLTTSTNVQWFLVFWMTAWTAGGLFAVTAWLWTAFGREIVTLGSGELRIRWEVLGVGRSKEFDLAQVRNLRVSAWTPVARSAGIQSPGRGGRVAFDYGAKTFRFGASIDEAEALQIIDELRKRHAF